MEVLKSAAVKRPLGTSLVFIFAWPGPSPPSWDCQLKCWEPLSTSSSYPTPPLAHVASDPVIPFVERCCSETTSLLIGVSLACCNRSTLRTGILSVLLIRRQIPGTAPDTTRREWCLNELPQGNERARMSVQYARSRCLGNFLRVPGSGGALPPL